MIKEAESISIRGAKKSEKKKKNTVGILDFADMRSVVIVRKPHVCFLPKLFPPPGKACLGLS